MKSKIAVPMKALVVYCALSLAACGGGGGGSGASAELNPYSGKKYVMTVVDPVTGLEWSGAEVEISCENSPCYSPPSSVVVSNNPPQYSQYTATTLNANLASLEAAKSYCESLDVSGKTDWRLPSVSEAYTSQDILVENAETLTDPVMATVKYGEQDWFPYSHDPLSAQFGYGSLQTTLDHTWPGTNHGPSLASVYFVKTPQHSSFSSTSVDSIDAENKRGLKAICVRGDNQTLPAGISGKWRSVGDDIEVQMSSHYGGLVKEFTGNSLKLSGMEPNKTLGFGYDEFKDLFFVREGMENVKLKGEISSVANRASPRATARRPTGNKSGILQVGDVDVILRDVSRYLFTAETAQNPAGTTLLASDGSGKLIVYCRVGADGRLILDDFSPVTTPSGSTQIDLEDHDGNQASFMVEILGDETDVGVLTIPPPDTEYNFKAFIDHGTDFIYFGSNPPESPQNYRKELSICNLGTTNISGTTFTIAPDPASAAFFRFYSHNYNGSATGFAAGECISYFMEMAFTRPVVDTEIKVGITIHDNFKGLTWDDYTSFSLSAHEPLNLYFASNSSLPSLLQGMLIAPGRQLLRLDFFSFEPFGSGVNAVQVPRKLGDEYQVILATTRIEDEAVYMISTDQAPNLSLMTGFANVSLHEPDNSIEQATRIPLVGGQAIGYLSAGDVDFYRLSNTP